MRRCGLVLLAIVCLEAVSWGQASRAVRSATINRQRWVDAQDSVERVLLLTPGGPIVLKIDVFIDGQPHEALRNKLLDDILKQADTDGDGRPTWKEAFDNPRFLLTPPSTKGTERQEQERNTLIKRYDENGNGVVDRSEGRRLLAQHGGGTGFVVIDGFQFSREGGGGRIDLKAFLDGDRDGDLSAEEIAAATDRLKSRDVNNNDLLEARELEAEAPVTIRNQALPTVFPLGPAPDLATIYTALMVKYGSDGRVTAEGMPLFPRLLDGLDRNANGELEKEEILGFNSMRPQVAITVRIKTSEAAPAEADSAGITVTYLAPEFLDRNIQDRLESHVALRLPGVRLTIAAPAGVAPPTANERRSAESLLNHLDIDKNGYLERKELVDGQATGQFAPQQFDRWDANGDGKVYVDEIAAELKRNAASQRTQVNLMASDVGTGLFSRFDQSGDNRLSVREIRLIPDRLRQLDADGDGRLSGTELPTELRVVITHGPRSAPNGSLNNSNSAPMTAPSWFIHMDRNDDGDLTLREFLGREKLFRELDSNGDGFIEPAEAASAAGRLKSAVHEERKKR